MTAEAKALLASAASLAARRERGSIQSADLERGSIQSADLAMALVSSGVFNALFEGQSRSEIMRHLEEIPREEPVFGMPVDVYVYSDPVKRILAYALEEAQRSSGTEVQPRHLLIGLLREGGCAPARLLEGNGVTLTRARSIR